MYMMYVDESGDPGKHPLSSPHFILSGLIVHSEEWQKYLDRLKIFRKALKTKYGLNQRVEIHTSELIRISAIPEYRKIKKSVRMRIIQDYCSEIPVMFDNASIVNVCIDIQTHIDNDIFELAWSRLLQRFNMFLQKNGNSKGIIIADDTDDKKLMMLQRRLKVYNPTPSHFSGSYNAPISNVLEDTFSRKSNHSYFIQTSDVIAHCLYRREYPKGSLRKFQMENQFNKLEPILLKKATSLDPLGIVRK